MEIYIYVVTDTYGNKAKVVTDDLCKNVFLSGLYDPSDPSSPCTFDCNDVKLDVENQSIISWKHFKYYSEKVTGDYHLDKFDGL